MGDSLKFGTSGLRGLASELTGDAARRYTAAFLAHLESVGQAGARTVMIGRDFRPSSPAIAADVAAAIAASGRMPVDCGALPTPALALYAMAAGSASIMVTGSHIPADRNGLKFYTPAGEITKADEAGIVAALGAEALAGDAQIIDAYAEAGDAYRQRYRGLLAANALRGLSIGVFEHSSVARDILVSVLVRAGAKVVRLGRVDAFVAVDTEAFSDPVFAPVAGWIAEHGLDALVSTDGDGDRPLLVDGAGQFVRGDVLGMITARYLGARTVVTPVTSNSAIEAMGAFASVVRTKVGSPYVIDGMQESTGAPVVGFEANGGTLLGTGVTVGDKQLSPLPTRDAVLPILATLAAAREVETSVEGLVASLPVRAALSDRLADVPTERGAGFAAQMADSAFAANYFAPVGEVASISTIDGPRVTLASGDVVHYRPSGNAPELRCYVEGATPERAADLLLWGLQTAARAVKT